MGTQAAVWPRSTAHFIAAWDLHPDEVGDGCDHVGDVLKQQKKEFIQTHEQSFFFPPVLLSLVSVLPHLGSSGLQRDGDGDEAGAVLWCSEWSAEEHGRGLGFDLLQLRLRA